MTGGRYQGGVALITAMLAVAMVTVLAVAVTSRQHLDVRRTQNLLARDQAEAYARAVEQWALAMLVEDRGDGEGSVDHPNEPWAQEVAPPPFEGARIRLRLEDLQGRFNINSLVVEPGTDNEVAMKRFARLLKGLDIDPSVVQAAADWIDPSPEIRFPDGAGDNWYSRLNPPYRAANRPMASPSELRLVRGVGDDDWRRIAPYVSALPEPSPINVNTAPAPVLRSLAPRMSAETAGALTRARPDGGWRSVDDFLAHPAMADVDVDPDTLSVGSDFFLLRSEIALGRVTIRRASVIHRQGSGGRIIRRGQGWLD